MTLTSTVALLGLLLIVFNVAGVMVTRTFGVYSVINIAIITAGFYHLIMMRLGGDASVEAFLGRLLVAFAAGAITYALSRRHAVDKEGEAHR